MTTKTDSDSKGKEPSPEADHIAKLEAENDTLKQKNSWPTEESKKNAAKYKNLRDNVNESEREALEKAGKFQELYELEKKQRENLDAQNKQLNDSLFETRLVELCGQHASDAHDIRDVLGQRDHRSLLKVDGKTGDVTGMKEFVEAVKKDRPYLFKNPKAPGQVGEHPKFNAKLLDRPVENMNLDEITSVLKRTFVAQ